MEKTEVERILRKIEKSLSGIGTEINALQGQLDPFLGKKLSSWEVEEKEERLLLLEKRRFLKEKAYKRLCQAYNR